MSAIDIPAIRGTLGKLTYYTATFTFKQIAERVKPAGEELHTSKSLREQLQRALTDNHKSITEYILTQKSTSLMLWFLQYMMEILLGMS